MPKHRALRPRRHANPVSGARNVVALQRKTQRQITGAILPIIGGYSGG